MNEFEPMIDICNVQGFSVCTYLNEQLRGIQKVQSDMDWMKCFFCVCFFFFFFCLNESLIS